MGVLEAPRQRPEPAVMKGARCRECGNYTVIRKDGCDFLQRVRLGRRVRLKP
jgi:ribonucleoside-diphosphate reductase alpha chain